MNTALATPAPEVAPEMDMIVEQIGLISGGINFCMKRIAGDDVFHARMQRLSEELIALAVDFEAYAHHEVGEFDQLVDVLENRDNELVALRLELSLLHEKINDLKGKVNAGSSDYEAAVTGYESQMANLQAKLARLTESHKQELEKANGRASAAEKENKQIRTTNGDLTRKLHKELNSHLDTRKQLQISTGTVACLQGELDKVYREHDIINGMGSDKFWHGKTNQKLVFYIHVFHYPLKYPYDPRDIDTPRFVNNLSYHINLRTTYGVDLVTRLDEWGMVQYQALPLFKDEFPTELYDELLHAHHEIVAIRNPHLKRFIEWAHTFPLTALTGISDAHRKLLKEEMHVENLAQLGSCFTSDLTRLKGVGDVTARKLRALAYEQGAAWMAEHGAVELEKTMLGVGNVSLPALRGAHKVGRSKKHRKGGKR